MARVVVVGEGMAGLATAWFLSRIAPPDLDLQVTWVTPAAGDFREMDLDLGRAFHHEIDPFGLADDASDAAAVAGELLPGGSPPPPSPLAVLHRGTVRRLPRSPLELLSTPFLSLRGRTRALREALIPGGGGGDETVAQFALRRFGEESVDALFDPLAIAMSAGDPSRLSMRATLPGLAALERDHGGVLRGLAASRAHPQVRVDDRQLARAMSDSLPSGAAVRGVVTRIERAGAGFTLRVDGETERDLLADVAVIATPIAAATTLLASVDPDLASNLSLIPHAEVLEVTLAFDRRRARSGRHPVTVVCPHREGRRILGYELASPADRAVNGGPLRVRALIGGTRAPVPVGIEEDVAISIATEELRDLLAIDGDPDEARVSRPARAVPQYTVGHVHRLAAIDGRMRFLPSLFLTGSAYRGAGLGACVRAGRQTAQGVVRFLLSDDRGTPGFLEPRPEL